MVCEKIRKYVLLLCSPRVRICFEKEKKKIFVIHSLFVKVYFYEQAVEPATSSKDN